MTPFIMHTNDGKGGDEKNESITKNQCGSNNNGGHHRNPNNINMNNNGNNGNNGNNNNNNMNGNPQEQQNQQQKKLDQNWGEMFECLLQYIEEQRKKQTIGLSDKEREEWKWDGNVPTMYKVRCDILRIFSNLFFLFYDNICCFTLLNRQKKTKPLVAGLVNKNI